MKNLTFLVVSVALVSAISQADSLHPDTFRSEVAPVLSELAVTRVAKEGKVLKSNRMFPVSQFLIGIPVTVNPGSACTVFAGQQTEVGASKHEVIRMLGASDPVNDACIAVMPRPVKTQATISMSVLTGGTIPAGNIQYQHIQIKPLGMYSVVLDMGNDSVTVEPLFVYHRN